MTVSLAACAALHIHKPHKRCGYNRTHIPYHIPHRVYCIQFGLKRHSCRCGCKLGSNSEPPWQLWRTHLHSGAGHTEWTGATMLVEGKVRATTYACLFPRARLQPRVRYMYCFTYCLHRTKKTISVFFHCVWPGRGYNRVRNFQRARLRPRVRHIHVYVEQRVCISFWDLDLSFAGIA